MSPDAWVAVGTFLLFFATLGLVMVAAWQINAARVENRKTQTLLACGNYDLNEVIYRCRKTLIEANDRGALMDEAKALRLDIQTVLNFLDAIAIGISQKLYDEALSREHLQAIVAKQVAELIDSGALEKTGATRDNYRHLLAMHTRWSKT